MRLLLTHCSNVVAPKNSHLSYNDNLIEQINSYVFCRPNLNFGVYLTSESTYEALKSDNLAFYLVQKFGLYDYKKHTMLITFSFRNHTTYHSYEIFQVI